MDAQHRAAKSISRPYTLKRRAEQQAETRRRIVEAAVDLHTSLGPARTSLSLVAERAGVQRHTLYAHFPEERDLLLACSELTLSRAPLPDAAPWRSITDPATRLCAGLQAVYDWYGRNANLAACVLRDAEYHPLTQEINALRLGPTIADWRATLGAGLTPPQRAILDLALSFFTWRTLVRDSGLSPTVAVETMAQAIVRAE